jgi:hypothetical protein
MGHRFLDLLGQRHIAWVAAGLMLMLSLPALWAGFVGDDHYHRAMLLGAGEVGEVYNPLTDLFEFVPEGSGADRLRDAGVIPWWSHPELELGFLRPVTALTHMLDYALWPHVPALQHTQSMLWFGLGVVLVGIFYRQVHGATAVSGLAVLLFAVEDAHSMPIGWLANRNASIALVFGVLALLAHIRWRERGSAMWMAAAVTALACGLLAGENALGVVAYIAAWQIVMDRSTWLRRLAALLPYAALVVGWRLLYDGLGYGCTGSGLYIDPGRQPLVFAGALIERWPVLLASLWSQLNADGWTMLRTPGHRVVLAIAAAICVVVAALLARLVRSRPQARFWALGMALALVPMAAAFPMNRLLLFGGIGAFGLMAMLVDDLGLLGDEAADGRRWSSFMAKGLLVLHLPVAAILLSSWLALLPEFNLVFEAGSRAAPRDPALAEQSLIFANGQDLPCSYTLLIRQLDDDAPAPLRVVQLAPMATAAMVARVDDSTLLIETEDGWLDYPFDRLMRGIDTPFEVGELIESSIFSVEVIDITGDGRPLSAVFSFREALESESHRWLWWRDGRLVDFELPPVGGRVELRPESLLFAAANVR